MDILVNHAHVSPAELQPQGTVECLLRLMDDCEIAEAVCFAPFADAAARAGIEPNQWLARELGTRGRGRLHGFGTVDLLRSDIPEQVKRIADLGFRGIKLHHAHQEVPILSAEARTLYAAAERHGLFLVFHAAAHRSRLRDNRVLDFDEVAWDYPRLRFSLEHVGGYHFFPEALAVIFNHLPTPWAKDPCHVYGGLSSIFSTTRNGFWHLSHERLRDLVAQVGAEQLIFGLDFPYNREEETRLGLKTIRELGLTEEQQGKILGGNMRDILTGKR